MTTFNRPHPHFFLELGDVYDKILETKTALETRILLIKTAVDSGDYTIYPERIIHQMLGALDESSKESSLVV